MSLDNIDDAYGLSPIQTGMLYDSLADPEADVYVTYVTFDIIGEVDSNRLMQAWSQVFQKHQSLRAAFYWDGLDVPLQAIVSDVALVWDSHNWVNKTNDEQLLLMRQLLQSERKKKFDLSQAPLSRFNHIKIQTGKSRLVWSVHHLLADGLSTPIILEDVLNFYFDRSSLRNAEQSDVYQYSQYIQWLELQDKNHADEFWKCKLQNAAPTPTRLASRVIRSENNQDELNIPQIEFGLSVGKTQALQSFCRTHRITLSTLMHGVWALLIREYSGKTSSLFASTVSGRHADIEGMSRAVGLYLNAQPRLIDTEPELPLVEWLRQVQSEIHQCAKYDYSSLTKIQQNIKSDVHESPFESIITIGGHPSELDAVPENESIVFTNIQYQSTQSHYALAFLVFPGESLHMSLVYDSSRYLSDDIFSMSLYVDNLIDQMLLHPQKPPKAITERCAKIGHYISEAAEFSYHDDDARTVHGWFEAAVDKSPASIAIRFNECSLSYQALDRLSNRVANHIIKVLRPATTAPIGLMLPRSADQIACMLGVLKSGHAYVPIDPEFPVAIIEAYIAAANIEHIISSDVCFREVGLQSIECLSIDNMENESDQRPIGVEVNASSNAYVMFTSGSTGVPKGVQISHRNLLYSNEARLAYYGDSIPRFLLLSSIAFDSSVAGIYWSLCTGGTLILPKPSEEKNIQVIGELINREAATHTLCLPSYHQLLLEHVDPSLLNTLSVVVVAGEACLPDLVKQHFSCLPSTQLHNEYGPTEACVWSSVYQLNPSHEGPVPIGVAVGSTFIQVINEHGLPCPPGVEGEIVIGGKGLSSGYVNDEQTTAAKFVTNSVDIEHYPVVYKTGDLAYRNSDNNLVFTGRVDRQLKIRGHRIEPGAVESTLNNHEGIAQCVVVALDQGKLSTSLASGQSREALMQRLLEDYSPMQLQDALRTLNNESGVTQKSQNGVVSE